MARNRSGATADLERFNFEKDETRRRQHSAARPKVSGKTAFFPRNGKNRVFSAKRQAVWFEMHSISN